MATYPGSGLAASPCEGLATATSITDAKTIPVSLAYNGLVCAVDGAGFYKYNSSYSGIVDGTIKFAPNSGPGAWELLAINLDTMFQQLDMDLSAFQTALGNLSNTLSLVKSVDPASIAASTATTVAVVLTGSGCAVGDEVEYTQPSNWPSGLFVENVYVSSTDTVTLAIRNVTGGAIDAPAGNWRFTVRRYND